jgi:hypothetical protein
MKARKLGSSGTACQPGSAAKAHSRYCARSGAGFAGAHPRQGASPNGAQPAAAATISAKASRRMWIVYVEMAVALLAAGLIVWLTWPRKRK